MRIYIRIYIYTYIYIFIFIFIYLSRISTGETDFFFQSLFEF